MHDQLDLLVIDVDNTIFDFVGIWARAFESMIAILATETGREQAYWHKALREVHVRRHAIECPAALEDLSADADWAAPFKETHVLTHAASAYRRAWDTHLASFDGVRESLVRLTEHGWRIAAYTESDASIAATRLARLGLAGVIPRVFGRAPFSPPARREWALVEMPPRLPVAIDLIPRSDLKPNPTGLHDIVARCGGSVGRTVYVGDDLWKDVAMAQRLGMRALWAAYGTTRKAADAALLEHVAHWSAAEVAAERAASPAQVRPDITLHAGTELADGVATMVTAVA